MLIVKHTYCTYLRSIVFLRMYIVYLSSLQFWARTRRKDRRTGAPTRWIFISNNIPLPDICDKEIDDMDIILTTRIPHLLPSAKQSMWKWLRRGNGNFKCFWKLSSWRWWDVRWTEMANLRLHVAGIRSSCKLGLRYIFQTFILLPILNSSVNRLSKSL